MVFFFFFGGGGGSARGTLLFVTLKLLSVHVETADPIKNGILLPRQTSCIFWYTLKTCQKSFVMMLTV